MVPPLHKNLPALKINLQIITLINHFDFMIEPKSNAEEKLKIISEITGSALIRNGITSLSHFSHLRD